MTDEEKKAVEFVKSELYDEKEARNDYQSLTGLYGNLEIETILNLIEKQQKEIEELKKNKGYHLGFIDGGIAKRYEYEDKIKAKIEFIKNLKEKFYYEENVISILQSLLEKE